MSFWSENKNTFKSAGIATAKGIGTGTKALTKAGYSTYKKSDASRKGLPPPGESTRPPPPPMAPAAPLMEKEKLLSLPPPPKRTVPIHEAPSRGTAALPHLTIQAQSTPNNLPQNLPQTLPAATQAPHLAKQPVPIQQVQSSSTFSRPAMPTPAMEPVPPPRIPLQRAPAPQPSVNVKVNVTAPATPVAQVSQPQPQPQLRSSHQSPEPSGPRVPKPAPDASKFAPPPVHKNRGNFDTQKPAHGLAWDIAPAPVPRPESASGAGGVEPPSLPSRTSSTSSAQRPGPTSPPPSYTETASESGNTPSNTGSSRSGPEPQPARASVRYVEIDVSKFGPPPPRRVDAPGRAVSRSESVASSRSSVALPPPLPPKPLSATSTASNPLPSLTPVESPARPKKVPPPKPAKLQKPEPLSQQSTSDHQSSSQAAPAKVIDHPNVLTTPNFAAEIARLKLQKSQTPVSQTEEMETKPQYPSKPIKPSISQKSFSPEPEVSPKQEISRPSPPVKPPKPQKPPKPSKPSGISTEAVFGAKVSNESNDMADENAQTKPTPKPLVSPTSQRRILTPEQRIPGFRVPVKGQFHQTHTEEPHSSKEEFIHNESNLTTIGAKPHPQPIVIPLTAKPDVSDHSKPHLPGFRVPVKGQFHQQDNSSDMGSSLSGVNENGAEAKLIPLVSEITSREQPTSGRPTPPPAPPSRNSKTRSSVSSPSATPPPPPPTRNYIRNAIPLPPKRAPKPELDLELSTGWYASTSQLQLPASLSGLNYSTSYQASTKTFPTGTLTENTRSIDVRFKDLSKATYTIKWLDNNFANAVLELIKFTPSPIDNKCPSKKELWGYSEQFGNYITSWCLRKEGQKVGTGECWDLAKEALAKGCGKHAFVSQYYHHGYPILELIGNASGVSVSKGPEDEIRPGDILQFKLATLYSKSTGVTQTVGSPDHTSVVYEKDNDVIRVLEQNVQGVKLVRKGEYVLSNMVSGSVTVYRPVPAEWAE